MKYNWAGILVAFLGLLFSAGDANAEAGTTRAPLSGPSYVGEHRQAEFTAIEDEIRQAREQYERGENPFARSSLTCPAAGTGFFLPKTPAEGSGRMRPGHFTNPER